METQVLDVACGVKKVPGAIGIDIAKLPTVDVVHDLRVLPWPFESDYFDKIHCYHYLEHCDDVIKTMEELHRILKPGATLIIRVPHFSSNMAWMDPTHKRTFTVHSFDYYGEHEQSYYSRVRFKVLKRRMKWFMSYPNEKWYEKSIRGPRFGLPGKIIVRCVQLIIDAMPFIYERFLVYYTGGAEELYFELQKI